ncbi:MAG: Hpt domain-containing protein [Pseudomonadota bacterium]
MERSLSTSGTALLNETQLQDLVRVAGKDGTREILDAFWESTEGLIDLMRLHVSNSDSQSAASTAHAIKGSAANVGAQSLHEKAQLFETFCRTQDLANAADVEAIAELFEQTRAVFEAELDRL